MQNAADAAVMAGAWKFLEDEGTLSDYSYAWLIDFVPGYILKDPDTGEPVISPRSKATGDAKAKDYVKVNLATDDAKWNGNNIVDSYEKTNILTFDSNLYGRGQDFADYGYYAMWYQVILEEDVKHLFLPGWFAPMKAKVQSVAKITHYIEGPNLFKQTKNIAEKQTYAGWDYIKGEKGNNGTAADNRSVLSTGNKYRTGDKHRFELLRLNGRGGQGGGKGNPYTSKGNVDQTGLDDLFIDWQCDMQAYNEDVDLDEKHKSGTGSGGSWTHFFTEDGKVENLKGDDNLQRRIHGTINFEPDADGKFPYPVRDAEYLKNNTTAYNDMKTKQETAKPGIFKGLSEDQILKQIARDPPDPLFARIESEPIHDGGGYYRNKDGEIVRYKGNNGSSIRQIIINLNVANTTKYDSGKYAGEYSDRPVFFYYTGPEKYDSSKTDNYKAADYYDGYNELSHVRDSLPVIINFNADFRGIFFFPNSPVVINGNDKNFEGYVIAKEFVMLKTYDHKEYSDKVTRGGDFLRYVAPDTKDDVYYDRSCLVEGTIPVSSSDAFKKISINGETKYVLESDLITDKSDLIKIGSTTYSKDEAGSAETLAYASGNGKIKYYYTKRQKKNEGWTYAGTGWLDRKTAVAKGQLATFQGGWSYNNSGNDTNDNGNPEGQGVWRVKELLPDGTESDTWLDETDEYKNKFLLKVTGAIATHPPQYVYATADELLSKTGGYTKVEGTNYWKKDDAREYHEVTSNGQTYYLPKNAVIFDGDMLVPEDMNGVIPVKYCDENNVEQSGCARISDDTKPYYLLYQDDIQGNDTELNPIFVDELGNVQYRHKRDGNGKEIATNEDGSVAYETIKSNVNPKDDPALYRRAADEAVKKLTDKYHLDTEQMTAEEREAYLIENYSEDYYAEVTKLFKEKFPYLIDDNVAFFARVDFNLKSSVFDSFELVKMTESALYRRAADEAVTALTAKYGLDTETMSDADRRFYLEKYHETEYKSEVNRIFGAQFPYLLPGGDLADGVQFFNCANFNLASSVFDSFQLIRMTRYSYLNAKGDKRSINNIFTNVDALRTD